MKSNTLSKIFIITPLTLLILYGCGVVDQYKRHQNESTESYYAPDNLNSNTQKTGILLVDAISEKVSNTLSLSGVAIQNIKEPNNIILIGSFKTGSFLSQQSGVVVIPNLQTGKYRIIKVNMANVNMWEVVYMPKTNEYIVEIKAGKAHYFGQVNIQHPFGSTDRVIKNNYNKTRELESWKMVVEKYKESPWVNIINTRNNRLQ